MLKLYFSTWSMARVHAYHAKFLERGLESPYPPEWLEREGQDHLVTTKIDITGWYQVRVDALLAHKTQVDPTSPFWFGLSNEDACAAYPWEDYELVWSKVDAPTPEDDLFAGLRQEVAAQ